MEIQKGLILEVEEKRLFGKIYQFKTLRSTDGYCFYDKTEEVFDEDGNLTDDENKRQYMRYIFLGQGKDENDFVSVEIKDSYNIV